MKIGSWIHDHDEILLRDQIAQAADHGLQSVRSYDFSYAEKVAPALKQSGMSLFGGMYIEADALIHDWRSQLRLDELHRFHELGIPLEAICVGNELRQGGDRPSERQFTARLSFGLARLITAYRDWMDQHGYTTPLTYAMEGIVFDSEGVFHEWVWPLVDACDVISVNSYPMDDRAWFGFEAFEESRRFLHDLRVRNDRLVRYEARLRVILQQLEDAGKGVILSETGFPSAVGYREEAGGIIVPESDNARYGELMHAFMDVVRRVNVDYNGLIQAIYFYEWRDNLYHFKIWNEEQSPIHVAFGLCERDGTPKFNIQGLVEGPRSDSVPRRA